jgi:hypothetical protein
MRLLILPFVMTLVGCSASPQHRLERACLEQEGLGWPYPEAKTTCENAKYATPEEAAELADAWEKIKATGLEHNTAN